MFCNQCGQTLPDGSRFCNYCGAHLTPGREPVASNQRRPLEDRDPRAGVQSVAPGQAPRQGVEQGLEQGDDRLTGVQALEGQPEPVVFTLRPTLVFVIAWYIAAAFVVVASAIAMGLLHRSAPNAIGDQTAFLVIAVVAVLMFTIPIYKHFLRRREVYTLTNHKLEMRYGILARTVRNIPLRNIQDVTVTATAWQRLMALGDIVIDSASESGKILLREIHHPERYADMILAELRRRY